MLWAIGSLLSLLGSDFNSLAGAGAGAMAL